MKHYTILPRVKATPKGADVCSVCGGYGYLDHATVDYVPYGSGDVPMYGSERDPCAQCVGKGKCPRCGAEALKDEERLNIHGGHYMVTWTVCGQCGHEIDWMDGDVNSPEEDMPDSDYWNDR